MQFLLFSCCQHATVHLFVITCCNMPVLKCLNPLKYHLTHVSHLWTLVFLLLYSTTRLREGGRQGERERARFRTSCGSGGCPHVHVHVHVKPVFLYHAQTPPQPRLRHSPDSATAQTPPQPRLRHSPRSLTLTLAATGDVRLTPARHLGLPTLWLRPRLRVLSYAYCLTATWAAGRFESFVTGGDRHWQCDSRHQQDTDGQLHWVRLCRPCVCACVCVCVCVCVHPITIRVLDLLHLS
jgi:hypothetical protein